MYGVWCTVYSVGTAKRGGDGGDGGDGGGGGGGGGGLGAGGDKKI